MTITYSVEAGRNTYALPCCGCMAAISTSDAPALRRIAADSGWVDGYCPICANIKGTGG